MNRVIAVEWLKSANGDLTLIDEILHNHNLTHIMAFHAQQAIEKSFKAILEFYNIPVPRKHDLLFLKSSISPYLKTDSDDILDSLNRLYLDSRYPGELGLLPDGKPGIDDIKVFYRFALDIYKSAEKIIS